LSARIGAGYLGETRWVFTLDADHVGIQTFDDTGAQIAWSVVPVPWVIVGSVLVNAGRDVGAPGSLTRAWTPGTAA
jgi:hypothetical protein